LHAARKPKGNMHAWLNCIRLNLDPTLNLDQRSFNFKVIHFGGNRKPMYNFRPLIVTFTLSSTVSEIAGFKRPEPTV